MVKVTDKSAPDQRDSPNLPLEPTTSSSKKTTLKTGMETTRRPKTVLLKVPHTKSQLNILLLMVNTMPKRQSQTPKLPRLERQAKPPTASEERAPSTSVKSPANHSQSHLLVDNSPIATARTMLQLPKSSDPTATDDYF
jgi:hypothetical protein